MLDKALAKDPTERYLDAEEFLQALEDAAEARFGEDWLGEASVVELVAPTSAIGRPVAPVAVPGQWQ